MRAWPPRPITRSWRRSCDAASPSPAASPREGPEYLDLIEARTFDDRSQLLEYVPTVLDASPLG
ncbi:hypothetical protein L2X99_14595 [Microbacterium sp. KUDC0406]|uniref:hypothetical protein n=1 Tax=Microbacterium sp. KUDC0406 TaxID=2909588 RepID=UPI001F291700|nr:hypothetical protein [Microbacterium sp. KUDC0406]UJP09627.1 hypothetical protein L2X99_14595 [Microbacterium sp. KUDC0406]